MRVIGINLIEEYSKKHPDAAGSLSAWKEEAEQAMWRKPLDIKQKYVKASIINARRVIFNIRGNDYRLDAAVAYQTGIVQVMRIGTHLEYNAWKFE